MIDEYVKNEISPQVKFIAYCVEIYKQNKNLTGAEVSALFTKHKIWEYLYECHGALHTTGALYTIEDIDGIIAAGT